MGLMPDEFWSLTVREFHLKHAAFSRAEDRHRALFLELALMTAQYKDSDKSKMRQNINALRRYPLKQWLRLD